MNYHRGSMVLIIETSHSSMIYFIGFDRFLDGKSMEIDHFWSILVRFSRTVERRW